MLKLYNLVGILPCPQGRSFFTSMLQVLIERHTIFSEGGVKKLQMFIQFSRKCSI